jgi:hypothetical protein
MLSGASGRWRISPQYALAVSGRSSARPRDPAESSEQLSGGAHKDLVMRHALRPADGEGDVLCGNGQVGGLLLDDCLSASWQGS